MTTDRSTALPDGFGSLWVTTMTAAFTRHGDLLADLDRRCGDGDFGTNITTAFRRAEHEARAAAPNGYREWVSTVSRGFLGTGGTSGPLFGMFFRELARCTEGPEPTLAQFVDGLTAGVATVVRYGGAAVGDKTMIDAAEPAAQALREWLSGRGRAGGRSDGAAEPTDGAAQGLTVGAAAAVDGARSTVDLRARRGRASYVGEVAVGVVDPGAAAVAVILQCASAAGRGTSDVDLGWLTAMT